MEQSVGYIIIMKVIKLATSFYLSYYVTLTCMDYIFHEWVESEVNYIKF